MSDCKRCSPSFVAMEASSAEPNVSKKRKTASCEFQLRSSGSDAHRLPNSQYSPANFPDATVSPEASVDSAGTVVSGEFCSDRSPLSCCSSTYVVEEAAEVLKELNTMPLDLKVQTKGFETVGSAFHSFKSYSLLSESCGDSEELTLPVSEQRKFPGAKVAPPKEEIEEFFAMAEKYEQKRFAEKYNFDIVKDMPLEGRYQWVRLH